jgi:phage baseplate assembly protein gpV
MISKKKLISNYNADNLEIRNTAGTTKITLESNGNITIENSTQVDITSPTINLNGDVNVSQTLDAGTDVTTGSISLKNHVHGGVQSGGSLTSGPQ